MTAQTNRQFLLAKRPVGAATRETFTYQQVPVGEPAAGQILVKNEYLSLDPAMRGWMNEGKSYIPPVGIGEVMRALGVGQVIASNNPGFAVGDYVNGALGVQDYFLGEPRGFYKVDPKLAPLPRYLSALGMTGMTAYFALLDVGAPKASETVVLSRGRRCGGQHRRADRQDQRLSRGWASPAAPTSASSWSMNWVSTAPSTTRTKTSTPASSANAPRAWTCISITSGATSWMPCSAA